VIARCAGVLTQALPRCKSSFDAALRQQNSLSRSLLCSLSGPNHLIHRLAVVVERSSVMQSQTSGTPRLYARRGAEERHVCETVSLTKRGRKAEVSLSFWKIAQGGGRARMVNSKRDGIASCAGGRLDTNFTCTTQWSRQPALNLDGKKTNFTTIPGPIMPTWGPICLSSQGKLDLRALRFIPSLRLKLGHKADIIYLCPAIA
jgi:hypothetical protein